MNRDDFNKMMSCFLDTLDRLELEDFGDYSIFYNMKKLKKYLPNGKELKTKR